MDIGRSIFLDKQSQDFSAAYNSRNQICNTQVVVPNLLTYLLMTLLFKKVGTYLFFVTLSLSSIFLHLDNKRTTYPRLECRPFPAPSAAF